MATHRQGLAAADKAQRGRAKWGKTARVEVIEQADQTAVLLEGPAGAEAGCGADKLIAGAGRLAEGVAWAVDYLNARGIRATQIKVQPYAASKKEQPAKEAVPA